MKTITYNTHEITLYDSIEEMPITVFHRFNLYAAIDSGIGGTIEDVDRRLYRATEYLRHKQYENAGKEMDNLRQALAFVIENSNPEFLSFASLIQYVDGKPTQVTSPEDARALLNSINIKVGLLQRTLTAVKKKLRGKWLSTSLLRQKAHA